MSSLGFHVKTLLQEEEVIDYVKTFVRSQVDAGIYEHKTYQHNYKVICSTLWALARHNNGSLAESKYIEDGNEFLKTFDKLDQFNSLNIKMGSKVSVIEAQLAGNTIELWGFLNPKTITDIYQDEDGFKFVFNNDPSDVYPRSTNIEYNGASLYHSAFFGSYTDAHKALMWLNLHQPAGMSCRDRIIKEENEMSSILTGVNESSIMKGIVDEAQEVFVLYIDGKPSTKYAKKHDAEADLERIRKKFPNKRVQIKTEVRGGVGGNRKLSETEAKKGVDGKRCWKGKRYAGTENGKDKCIPVKNEAANPAQQAAIAIAKKKKAKTNEGVIVGHDANDPEIAVLGGGGTMSLSRLKTKAAGEAQQLYHDMTLKGNYKAAAYNVKQLVNTLNTIVAAEEEMKKRYFGEDYTGQFAAEKTPAINPYGGLKDAQHRGAISEDRELYNAGAELEQIAAEMKELADNAMNLVRSTPEEGRARSYWYPHIVMAISQDHSYMGKNMFTMMDSAQNLMDGDEEEIDENAWNQLGQRKPNTNLPAPDRGSRVNHGRHFQEGDIVVPLSGPLKGQPHKVVHSQRTSIRIVPLGRDSYPGDTIAPRTKHEWVVPADMNEAREPSDALRAAQKNLVDLSTGEVRRREDAKKAAAKRQREYDREFNRKPKKPTLDQIWQKIEHAISNYFPDGDPTDYLNPYMERNGLTWDDITRASKKNGYKDLWDYWNSLAQDIENDAYYDWHAAKRPEAPVNPLSKDAADIQHRNWVAKKNPKIRTRGFFLEEPTDPVGTQPGGWRRTDMEEDTAYAGGMGQGGNAGESYRKFTPKSAGTYKESSIMKGIKRESK